MLVILTKLKPGQIVSLREVREENSILRRNDKKTGPSTGMQKRLLLHRCCSESRKHLWVLKLDICSFLPGKLRRCCHQQLSRARAMK